MPDVVFPPVNTKRDFVKRYNRTNSEFGNRAPSWNTLAEFQCSGYTGLVHIRNRKKGGPTWYNVHSDQLESVWREIVAKGLTDPGSLYLSAMAPHHKGTIQGEIQQGMDHLQLTYCSAQLPMRESMAVETKHMTGLGVSSFLQQYMDPPSHDWLCELLVRYPMHVIEFSCFSIPWGTLPSRNTVFWEVRLYQLLGFVVTGLSIF